MAQESLSVGWENWQPYSYRDEQQQLRGLDVALLNAIFLRAGYQAKFSEMPWARVLHELEFGTVQLAMSANITPERQKYARFSHPYREEKTAIIIRRQDAERWHDITSLEQLINTPDFHIGVLKGFDYGNTFRQLMARPELQPRLHMRLRLDQLLKMLQGGRIQGFILDPQGLQGWQGKDEEPDQLHTLLRIEVTPVHLMLSKESTTEAQLQRINQAIEQLKQSPDYQQILYRYQPSSLHP
ncbi:amino acid ABC transporter substrate-binding protein [Aeromonas australiensis]|uniref:substrate-binding periplasmic protein n=1 Tax=Aeromonas australiensis TaxID=1114880 RepID=UPI001F2A9A9F|nr:transporter substrate-binding domain-containing protein [Aeromonas australiensis]MCF3095937.1 amino acid ABC transporter substrate-binding protein [Aeromonas australiensis]